MKGIKILGLSFAIAFGISTLALAKDKDKDVHDKGATTQKDHDNDHGKAHEQHIMGKVVSVSGSTVTVETGKGDKAKQVSVETDANTKVKINGKEAAVADLKEGMKIKVEPASGVATRIIANDRKDKDEAKEGEADKHKGDEGDKHKHGDSEKHKDHEKSRKSY